MKERDRLSQDQHRQAGPPLLVDVFIWQILHPDWVLFAKNAKRRTLERGNLFNLQVLIRKLAGRLIFH
jgi:hypothetical protein